jgi:hypothetical protein
MKELNQESIYERPESWCTSERLTKEGYEWPDPAPENRDSSDPIEEYESE